MTTHDSALREPYERRALLLHLGDVLETVFCLSQCADEYPNIADAVRGNDALAAFTLLGFIDGKMTPRDFIRRASGAFFVWPKALLDETLNQPMLANTVRHDLFEGNAKGWRAYADERRREVPWFGEDLPDAAKSAEPAHAAKVEHDGERKENDSADTSTESRYKTWPWRDKGGKE